MAASKTRRASTAKKDPKKTKDAVTAIVGEATKIRAADKARVEALLALIARRKARISEDFYEIGKALREIQHDKLYLAIGFTSFADMLKGRDVMSLTVAKKLVAVVESLPVDKALSLGVEKAYALARYTATTPDLDSPALLLDADAKIGGKKVSEATVRDLTLATRKVSKKAKPKTTKAKADVDPEEAVANKAARGLSGRLHALKIRGASVSVKRDDKVFALHIEVPVASASLLLGHLK